MNLLTYYAKSLSNRTIYTVRDCSLLADLKHIKIPRIATVRSSKEPLTKTRLVSRNGSGYLAQKPRTRRMLNRALI